MDEGFVIKKQIQFPVIKALHKYFLNYKERNGLHVFILEPQCLYFAYCSVKEALGDT